MSHMDTRMSWEPDKPHEECGVFGMYDLDGNDVASSIYYGLFALQHRGQESCGIAVSDTFGPRKVDLLKGMGLVNEVFNQENIASLTLVLVIAVIQQQEKAFQVMHSLWLLIMLREL